MTCVMCNIVLEINQIPCKTKLLQVIRIQYKQETDCKQLSQANSKLYTWKSDIVIRYVNTGRTNPGQSPLSVVMSYWIIMCRTYYLAA